MSQRFYCQEIVLKGNMELTGQEAQHLVKVMRANIGEQIELFDGKGKQAIATISVINKRSVELIVNFVQEHIHLEQPKLTLAVAPPKGERLDFLIEKITELGIHRLELVQTARTVVLPGAQKMHRLEQLAISACKQSGRLLLPELVPLTTFQAWVKKELDAPRVVIIADPRGEKWATFFQQYSFANNAREIVVCVGPEGGFSPDELTELGRLSCYKIKLADNILRIETAAMAFASCLVAQFRSG